MPLRNKTYELLYYLPDLRIQAIKSWRRLKYIEIFCPKCGDKMTIEIKDGKILVQRILSNKAEST